MILTNISTVRDLLSRHGFSFSKSLGQNFLINPSVCPRMAEGITGGVLEIGAGIGVLTRELAERAEKVAVIEIDEGLKPILSETLRDCPNVEIIWGDALKLDLRDIIDEHFPGAEIDVCANLPYYAATRIIMDLLEQRLPIRTITVMVQEEVAERFTAAPRSKQYGSVSVAALFYSRPKLLFKVPRGSFMPKPNVDSAVIRFDVFEENLPDVPEPEKLLLLVKTAFSERRKQLCNPVSRELGVDKEKVKTALASIGVGGNARAEELGAREFIALYKELS